MNSYISLTLTINTKLWGLTQILTIINNSKVNILNLSPFK